MRNNIVIVIDEDKNNLDEVGRILAMGGYLPVLIDDALVAADRVIHHKPNAILIDLKILRRSGSEIAHAVDQLVKTSRLPIIAMSEFVKDEFSGLLKLFSIKTYLRKPFQPLDVIWAIENEIYEMPACRNLVRNSSTTPLINYQRH